MGDDFNLKKVFSHEKEPQAYDPIGNQAGFVLVLLYLSIYTIVMTQITFRTGDAYEISASIRAIFENYPIDTESRTYGEISDKYNIIDFFNNILIKQIFDESVKKFESGQDGYHYINNYNYFGGMRLTHNRVDLKRYSRDSLHDWTRRKNYQGRTNQRFTSINTDYFWLEDKEYSQHGGYFDKGGFIYFLKSDTTYEEATAFSDNAEYNWMFDEEYLTLTFEIMFYNQNLQTGVFICYEFLNNNAAVIEKHVFVDSFFVSAYSSYNNIFASWSITFIIVLDVIWLI